MTSRTTELLVFSILGVLSVIGLVQAVRHRSSWIAAMVVAVVICGVVVWSTSHGTTFTGV
jgi:hypothetical protein